MQCPKTIFFTIPAMMKLNWTDYIRISEGPYSVLSDAQESLIFTSRITGGIKPTWIRTRMFGTNRWTERYCVAIRQTFHPSDLVPSNGEQFVNLQIAHP